MNWKLICVLSLIAIPMGFATVYYIPYNLATVIWLVIFIACAFIIARFSSRNFFLHGVIVSVFDAIWITAIHFLFFDAYLKLNPQQAAIPDVTPQQLRYLGLIFGPLIGMLCGVLLGLFSRVAAKILKKA
jgi:LytS/YehU family sensor histidine kinase